MSLPGKGNLTANVFADAPPLISSTSAIHHIWIRCTQDKPLRKEALGRGSTSFSVLGTDCLNIGGPHSERFHPISERFHPTQHLPDAIGRRSVCYVHSSQSLERARKGKIDRITGAKRLETTQSGYPLESSTACTCCKFLEWQVSGRGFFPASLTRGQEHFRISRPPPRLADRAPPDRKNMLHQRSVGNATRANLT